MVTPVTPVYIYDDKGEVVSRYGSTGTAARNAIAKIGAGIHASDKGRGA